MLSRPPGANRDRVPIYTPWNLWIWIRFCQKRGRRVCLDHFHSPNGQRSLFLYFGSIFVLVPLKQSVYLTRTALVGANELYSVAVVLVENIGVFQSRMSHLSTTLGKGLSILFNTTLYCIHNHSLLFPDPDWFHPAGSNPRLILLKWFIKGRCAQGT